MEDETTPPEAAEVTWDFVVGELPSDTPIEGATFTPGSDTYTSDASGAVSIQVPAESYVQVDMTADVKVDIDLDYDISIVDGATQPTGFGVGDTSIDAAVTFTHVAPGPVTISLTPPPGYRCDHIPPSVEIITDEYHEATVHCGPE